MKEYTSEGILSKLIDVGSWEILKLYLEVVRKENTSELFQLGMKCAYGDVLGVMSVLESFERSYKK